MDIDFYRILYFHPFGECATGLIAHFSAALDFCVASVKQAPPMNMEVPSSSRLARDAEKCTLKPVQLRNLGVRRTPCNELAVEETAQIDVGESVS